MGTHLRRLEPIDVAGVATPRNRRRANFSTADSLVAAALRAWPPRSTSKYFTVPPSRYVSSPSFARILNALMFSGWLSKPRPEHVYFRVSRRTFSQYVSVWTARFSVGEYSRTERGWEVLLFSLPVGGGDLGVWSSRARPCRLLAGSRRLVDRTASGLRRRAGFLIRKKPGFLARGGN